MADRSGEVMSRREFLKLAVATATGLAGCNLVPRSESNETSDYPEGMEVADGGNLRLMVEGQNRIVTIRYQGGVDELVAREGELNESMYSYTIHPLKPGQTTRRKTGEIVDSRIEKVVLAEGVSQVEVLDTAGGSTTPSLDVVGTIKPGEQLHALRVITSVTRGDVENGLTEYEVNGLRTETMPNMPFGFGEGWAVGQMLAEKDNPNPVFMLKGFVHKRENSDSLVLANSAGASAPSPTGNEVA